MDKTQKTGAHQERYQKILTEKRAARKELLQLSFNHPDFWKNEINKYDPPTKKTNKTTKRASRPQS